MKKLIYLIIWNKNLKIETETKRFTFKNNDGVITVSVSDKIEKTNRNYRLHTRKVILYYMKKNPELITEINKLYDEELKKKNLRQLLRINTLNEIKKNTLIDIENRETIKNIVCVLNDTSGFLLDEKSIVAPKLVDNKYNNYYNIITLNKMGEIDSIQDIVSKDFINYLNEKLQDANVKININRRLRLYLKTFEENKQFVAKELNELQDNYKSQCKNSEKSKICLNEDVTLVG